MKFYTLDDKGNPVHEQDVEQWGKWFETSSRSVARTEVGESSVSTVFLGLDHDYSGKGPPILWETIVFGGPLDQEQDRCSGLREQAEAMHAKMVERVETETNYD